MLRSRLIKKAAAFNRGIVVKKHFFSTDGALKNEWISVVGLEVHAQIHSTSKLFSGASTKFSSPVNTNVALFDCSMPGTLPVLNKKCVEMGVLTALALKCKVNPVSMFDRKHYFYADLPTGYQITQQRLPLAVAGDLEFQVYIPETRKKPYKKQVRIKQLQLEQDSAKSLHDYDRSLIDINRAGVGLMEVVFEPDLSNGEEAAALVKELVAILQKLGTCSCKMEEGALRVDANVSIHKQGEPLGIRTEIKNIGSIRGVAGAIQHEIQRQVKLVSTGEKIINETRAWDASSKITVAMRDKEEVQDYRYMPEPNLPPLHVSMGAIEGGSVDVNKILESMPELPEATRIRLQESFGLSLEHSIVIVNDNYLLDFFEKCMSGGNIQSKLLVNLLINELLSLLNKQDLEFSDVAIPPHHMVEIVVMLQDKLINRQVAKGLLHGMVEGNKDAPTKIVNENNLMQITNDIELEKLCKEVLNENPKIVDQYKSGKVKVYRALLGKIAEKSKEKADMAKCDTILKQLLRRTPKN